MPTTSSIAIEMLVVIFNKELNKITKYTLSVSVGEVLLNLSLRNVRGAGSSPPSKKASRLE